MSRFHAVLCVGLCGMLVAACENAGVDRVLAIEATGVINGIVYFDVNGSRVFDITDVPHPGVRVRFVARGTRDTTAVGQADANGAFRVTGVPVGTYLVVVDSATVGDSVSVVKVDTSEVAVRPMDSAFVSTAVSYPVVSVAAARASLPGRRVFVTGITLNAVAAFGDSTIHLVDTSGTIRGTRITGTGIAIGDSVRLFGIRSERNGQPTLDNAVSFPVGQAILPGAIRVTTAVAATADTGRLDAALVRVINVGITATATVLGDYIATVDDGSGPLDIVFDADAGLVTTPYIVGAQIDALGVLVPTGTGTWRLKPRVNADVILN